MLNLAASANPKDPFPGDYISQTAFTGIENQNERDPRRYVDARDINYVVRGDVARRRGARVPVLLIGAISVLTRVSRCKHRSPSSSSVIPFGLQQCAVWPQAPLFHDRRLQTHHPLTGIGTVEREAGINVLPGHVALVDFA